jgi:hypothetical protein
MECLKRNITSHLRAEDAVLHEFTEIFTLRPLTSTTTGYTVNGRRFFSTEATFQIEGNDKVGLVGSFTNQDGTKFLELYLEDKTIEIDTKKDFATSARAVMLSDKRIKRALGKSISLTQLTRGDSLSNVGGRNVQETFEVEGLQRTGIVSIAATEVDVTRVVLYVGDDEIRIDVPQRSLGATTA